MGQSKLTTFAVTFGSILAGLCGATYGSDGLYFLNYYMSTEVTSGLSYRAIIAACALVAYEGLLIFKLTRKSNKKAKEDSSSEVDPYSAPQVMTSGSFRGFDASLERNVWTRAGNTRYV